VLLWFDVKVWYGFGVGEMGLLGRLRWRMLVEGVFLDGLNVGEFVD
jgi:hypothetical protein